MPDQGPPLAKPSAFWGSVLLSARVHATTAEVWTAIRDYARTYGVDVPPDMFAQVNRMRTLAVGLRNSGEALASARPSDAITSNMIGQQLYARSLSEQALAPAFHVRFTLDAMGPDGPVSGWYNLEYDGSLPPTVGDLYADLDTYAATLGESYGLQTLEVGTIEIGGF